MLWRIIYEIFFQLISLTIFIVEVQFPILYKNNKKKIKCDILNKYQKNTKIAAHDDK